MIKQAPRPPSGTDEEMVDFFLDRINKKASTTGPDFRGKRDGQRVTFHGSAIAEAVIGKVKSAVAANK